jgi:hypothetical protein
MGAAHVPSRGAEALFAEASQVLATTTSSSGGRAGCAPARRAERTRQIERQAREIANKNQRSG